MKITAVISEYNPFHNGHAYHISAARQKGATHIVSVMSGNYVQRGEAAIIDKWTRARIALDGGVDLVVELPTPWSVNCAEKFAFGAMSIIKGAGVIDCLSFGCECPDCEKLIKTADILLGDGFSIKIKKLMETGISYPNAVESVVACFDEALKQMVSSPNNTLAVEYIKAMKSLSLDLELMPIGRKGAGHDALTACGGFADAAFIRELICCQNKNAVKPFISSLAYDIIRERECFDFSLVERAVLSRLRQMTRQELCDISEVREGLENRIFNAVKISNSVAELYDNIKTKRYTHAAVRRITLNAYLGVTKDYSKMPPPYIRVLGFNERGVEILRKMRDKAVLPVAMTAGDIFKLGERENRLFELESRCSDVYNLGFKTVRKCSAEMTENTVRIL